LHADLGVRLGTDVESIASVAESLERYGNRYASRLFTEHELTTCGGSTPDAAPRLAARFAAKEAVLKLLSPRDEIPRWRSIEVRTAANGAPSIVLHDEATRLANEQGIGTIALSMSHGAGVGLATVVALTAPN
jgi:holo-[acyl-carrier protein] synthase